MNLPENKEHRYLVTAADFAIFNSTIIHKVCSTYALTREFEWAGRLVLLPLLQESEEGIGAQMSLSLLHFLVKVVVKQESEEGIGTSVHLEHLAPAFEGEEVLFTATPRPWQTGEELLVDIEAFVGSRKIASGYTGQRILPKTTIQKVFEKAKSIS
ncbi:MAG: thioesterase family protein [Flexibacteraceae bacterium]